MLISWIGAEDDHVFIIRRILAFIQRLLERALPSWSDHELDLADGWVELELKEVEAGDH